MDHGGGCDHIYIYICSGGARLLSDSGTNSESSLSSPPFLVLHYGVLVRNGRGDKPYKLETLNPPTLNSPYDILGMGVWGKDTSLTQYNKGGGKQIHPPPHLS